MVAFLLYAIHIVVCIFLILVVLLQQGKGADLSVFGGGATMTAFGARGAATLLHKLTVVSFILFIITTLVIGVLESRRGESSVMSGVVSDEEPVAATDADSEEPVEINEPTGALPDDAAGEAAPGVEEEEGSAADTEAEAAADDELLDENASSQ